MLQKCEEIFKYISSKDYEYHDVPIYQIDTFNYNETYKIGQHDSEEYFFDYQ